MLGEEMLSFTINSSRTSVPYIMRVFEYTLKSIENHRYSGEQNLVDFNKSRDTSSAVDIVFSEDSLFEAYRNELLKYGVDFSMRKNQETPVINEKGEPVLEANGQPKTEKTFTIFFRAKDAAMLDDLNKKILKSNILTGEGKREVETPLTDEEIKEFEILNKPGKNHPLYNIITIDKKALVIEDNEKEIFTRLPKSKDHNADGFLKLDKEEFKIKSINNDKSYIIYLPKEETIPIYNEDKEQSNTLSSDNIFSIYDDVAKERSQKNKRTHESDEIAFEGERKVDEKMGKLPTSNKLENVDFDKHIITIDKKALVMEETDKFIFSKIPYSEKVKGYLQFDRNEFNIQSINNDKSYLIQLPTNIELNVYDNTKNVLHTINSDEIHQIYDNMNLKLKPKSIKDQVKGASRKKDAVNKEIHKLHKSLDVSIKKDLEKKR